MSHSPDSAFAPSSPLDLLAERLSRPLLRPGNDGYDAARSPWNLAVQQHPLAIAFPQDIAEVQEIVAAATAAAIGVTVQPQGHGANGSLDDCILIRPEALNEIAVDAAAKSVRVGAGVMWGAVLAALDGIGLIALAGSNPEVSVLGYSLSGGHSAFSRAHGLAAQSITAIELVDAGGELRRVTAESDAELFWALRGGSGLFGVVTALELSLFAGDALYGGKLSFSGADAETVFRAALEVLTEAPDDLTIYAAMMTLPNLPMVPESMRGQTIASLDVVYIGDDEGGSALIEPLRTAGRLLSDDTGPFTIGQLAAVAGEPTEPMGAHDWSTMLGSIDGETTDRLVAGFREASKLGASMLQIRPLGGALRGHADTAVANASGFAAACFASVILFDPDMASGAEAALEPLREAAATWATPGSIVSLLPGGSDLSGAYDEPTLARLRAVKESIDPNGVFRSNRPLPAS